GGKKNTADRKLWEAGSWDMMSDCFGAGHFLNWHRDKLGWIAPNRKDYITYGWAGTTNRTLTPYHTADSGITMLAIALTGPEPNNNKLLVFEVAEPIPGTTGDEEASGIIVYTVNSK